MFLLTLYNSILVLLLSIEKSANNFSGLKLSRKVLLYTSPSFILLLHSLDASWQAVNVVLISISWKLTLLSMRLLFINRLFCFVLLQYLLCPILTHFFKLKLSSSWDVLLHGSLTLAKFQSSAQNVILWTWVFIISELVFKVRFACVVRQNIKLFTLGQLHYTLYNL